MRKITRNLPLLCHSRKGRSHFRHSFPVLRVSNRILPSTFLGNSRLLRPDLMLRYLVMQILCCLALGRIIWRCTAWVDLFWWPRRLRFPDLDTPVSLHLL